jgi:DNA-directed RNA polymerase subunit beta'
MDKNNLDITSISVRLASPEEIMKWSYGEVVKPETLNYRTQRPEKDGLFSERIFGPTKDYECYCGKYKKVRYKGIVCEKCGVEVTRAIVRRERMAHITLAAPVAHIWFLRTVPSKLGLILDISVSKLEKVVYYAAFIVTRVNEENRKRSLETLQKEFKTLKGEKGTNLKNITDTAENLKQVLAALKPGLILMESEYFSLAERFGDVFEADRGAGALRKILEQVDLKTLVKRLRKELEEVKDENRLRRVLRRLKIAQSMLDAKIRPEWMIFTVLPILPPELRPMVALEGGRYATADLNDLYRRVINRNNRLKKLMDLRSPEVIITNEKRMLQEAVDALIDNTARAGVQLLSTRRRPLRSLADMLKGKQGRFRQNLLGKRVDYSARSVIVVGPELKLDECGLPKNMALELFRHFVINKIIERGLAFNIKQANRFIEQGSPEVWEILEEVIKNKRVLLNRAPTLHRLGIQAFKPQLIEDLAIRIPPLVCSAFNADFDGDQMAVHLPLTAEAQYEASTIMNAATNLLKPSSGDPIVTPTLDMVLGVYFLTRIAEGAKGEGKALSSFSEAMHAYESGYIAINATIKVPVEGKIIETSLGRLIFNSIFPADFGYVNEQFNKKKLPKFIGKIIEKYGIAETSQYIDAIKNIGYEYATLSAITWSTHDMILPKEKKAFIKAAEESIVVVESQFNEGLLTEKERFSKVIEIWSDARDKIAKCIPIAFTSENPIFMIVDSGSRGSWAQSSQMMGMKGLVGNPKGETIELPIKSSYKEGLRVIEFFNSTHGARKGTTDTALKTATAGYLTRRLVDVSQDIIVQEQDCGTDEGTSVVRKEGDEFGYAFGDRLYSRVSVEDIRVDRKLIAHKGEIITRDIAKAIHDSKVEVVKVRSPISCKTTNGICAACYGYDLTKNKLVAEGTAVGIIAAQSIGEPGTQLTMRTFHAGGVAGVDITHGLPRVEEIFEARPPKGKAPLAKTDGIVDEIEEKGLARIIKIKKSGGKIKKGKTASFDEYLVPGTITILVKEGERVKRGDALTEGPLDIRELLAFRGLEEAEHYIINEVQRIYVPEGASINDKHIEIIVRQMLSRVIVKEQGDGEAMPGDLVEKNKFIAINRVIKKKKGVIAKGILKVLGITRVALNSTSFLSAASFQETSRVLVNASVEGKIDPLNGLKENVIIGKLIPAGTGKYGISEDKLTPWRKTVQIPVAAADIEEAKKEMEAIPEVTEEAHIETPGEKESEA